MLKSMPPCGLYRKRTAEIIEIGKKVSDQELAGARANCSALRQELETSMAHAGIDLWVSPSALGPAPEGIHATGDPTMNLPWTHAGMPAITLPAGRSKNVSPWLAVRCTFWCGRANCLPGAKDARGSVSA